MNNFEDNFDDLPEEVLNFDVAEEDEESPLKKNY